MRIHRVGMVAMLAAALVATLAAGSALAAGNTLKVDAAATSVAKDATFTIKIVHTTAVAVSGAQMTLTFDKAKVQVTKVTRGAPYASSSLFLGAEPANIAAANKSGRLQGIAAAFFPPASVPAGTQEFLVIEMKAVACGESKLGLPVGAADGSLLDGRDATYAAPLKVTAAGGTVSVVCSGAAGSPAAPGASVDAGAPPLPSGDVPGEAPSLDPLASTDPDSVAGASPLTEGSTPPATVASPDGDTSPVSSTSDLDSSNSQWLDFALAALAVAAAGLALLIVVVVLAIVIAGVIGLVWLIRTIRRPVPGAPGATPDVEPPLTDPADTTEQEEEEYDPLAAEGARTAAGGSGGGAGSIEPAPTSGTGPRDDAGAAPDRPATR